MVSGLVEQFSGRCELTSAFLGSSLRTLMPDQGRRSDRCELTSAFVDSSLRTLQLSGAVRPPAIGCSASSCSLCSQSRSLPRIARSACSHSLRSWTRSLPSHYVHRAGASMPDEERRLIPRRGLRLGWNRRWHDRTYSGSVRFAFLGYPCEFSGQWRSCFWLVEWPSPSRFQKIPC